MPLLEQHFDTNYLGVCLENSTYAARAIQEAKTDILRKDWNCTVREARTHPSLTIVCGTDFIAASWNSTWDQALEFGVRGKMLMQILFNSLSRAVFGNKCCPRCEDTITTSYQEHLFSSHLNKYSTNYIVMWLDNRDHKHFFNWLRTSHLFCFDVSFYFM